MLKRTLPQWGACPEKSWPGQHPTSPENSKESTVPHFVLEECCVSGKSSFAGWVTCRPFIELKSTNGEAKTWAHVIKPKSPFRDLTKPPIEPRLEHPKIPTPDPIRNLGLKSTPLGPDVTGMSGRTLYSCIYKTRYMHKKPHSIKKEALSTQFYNIFLKERK